MTAAPRTAPGCRLPWWGLMVLLLVAGCDDTADLCDPVPPAGRVQGRVLSGGLSLEAEIIAKTVDGEYPDSGDFRIQPDETGFYALDLPAGRYVFELDIDGGLYVHTSSGAGLAEATPDTIDVGAGIATPDVDFILGGLTVRFELPKDMHGQYGQVTLHPSGFEDWDWRLMTNRTEEIVLGILEIELAGVLPGDYRVEMALGCPYSNCGETAGERFWLPGTHDPDQSPIFSVAPDSVLSIDGGSLADPARLEGRITGAWLDMGIPQEPVVSVVSEDSLTVMQRVGVEDDGSFAADFLVPAAVKLLVAQSEIETWVGGPTFADATVFNLESGRTIAGIEHRQCGIHLILDDAGLQFQGGEIQLFDKADLSRLAVVNEFLRSDRHLAIPNLWPGEFLILVEQDPWMRGSVDWRPQWFDRAATSDLARPISLTAAGQVARGNLVLEAGGVISGRLSDPEGAVPYFSLKLYRAGEENYWTSRFYGGDEYRLTGLPDGDYVFSARPNVIGLPDDQVVWYPGVLDRTEAAVIQIRDAAVIDGADIVIPR